MRGIRFLLACLALLVPVTAAAQIDAFNGFCTQGGKSVTTQGLGSTNKAQIIIPSCQVDVYLTGTTTHATIYSDSLGTVLGNPFTADNLTAVAPGRWSFWAANGQGYDVVMSGGIPPLTFTAPVTLVDLKVGGGGGTGVTSFSAGNFPPLFNTNVANPGTTPALSFIAANQTANTLFGNFLGTTNPAFFAKYTCLGLLNCSYDTPSNTFTLNVPSTTALSITATLPVRVNAGTGPVSSGTANIDCPTCGQSAFSPTVIPPIGGQYAIVYPTGGTVTSDPVGASNIFGSSLTVTGQGAGGHFQWQCNGLLCSVAGNVQAHWTGFSLPSYINPANVTAIYADAITSSAPVGDNLGWTDSYSGTDVTCNGQHLMVTTVAYPYASTEVSKLTTLTGATFNSTAQCQVQVGGSGPGNHSQQVNVAAIRFLVFYTGTPPPTDTTVKLQPPLTLNSATNTMFVDQANWRADYIFNKAIDELPLAAAAQGYAYLVWDAVSDTDCTTGGDALADHIHFCISTGSTWEVFPGASGGGGTTTNPLTANTTGGAAPGTTFNGSAGVTYDYHSFGAAGISGTPTTGNCASWASANTLQDAGAPCGSGGGSVGGSGTAGFIALWSASTTLANSPLDYGVTLANFVTSSKPIQVVSATDPSQISMTFNSGHPVTGTAGAANFGPDSTGNLLLNPNNTGNDILAPLASGFVSGHCGQPTSSGGVWTIADAGAACGSGSGGGGTNTIDLTKSPYYASCSATTTTTTASSGSTTITVGSSSTFSAGQGIFIAGAGAVGTNQGDYVGTVSSVPDGTHIVISPATGTTVTGATVQHDETAAIQSAWTALGAGTLTGTPTLPAGVCNVNGPLQNTSSANAVLVVPNFPYFNSSAVGPGTTISLVGASNPLWLYQILTGYSTYAATSNGTVIQTSRTSGNLIGGKNTSAGTYGAFTMANLYLNNLTFRAPANPAITMVNAGFIASLSGGTLSFDTMGGVTNLSAPPVQPTSSNGIALVAPGVNNDAQSWIDKIQCNGYYACVSWGEHMVIQQLSSNANWTAVYFGSQSGGTSGGHTGTITRLNVASSAYALLSSGTASNIIIDSAQVEDNWTSSWATSAANHSFCNDSGNNITGNVRSYLSTTGGYTQKGAGCTNLLFSSLGQTNATQANGTAFSGLATLAGAAAGDIAYYNGSAWTKLTGNSSGTQVLSENSSGTPAWISSGAYPAAVTLTASNSAELDFTTCISSSYKNYQITLNYLTPVSDSNILLQVSTNGGSTYDTTSGHYTFSKINIGVSSGVALAGTADISAVGMVLGTDFAVNGTGIFIDPLGSHGWHNMSFHGVTDAGGTRYAQQLDNEYNQTAAINAFRIIAQTGNLSSGSVTCQPLPAP